MSYDVVALVAREPDTESVAKALRDIDPELWLHRHEETEVLQIRGDGDRLLASLEPGRLVESADEIPRLLGSDVSRWLPERCWWMEIRARPDARGREVAHRFADGLALRLGGAVWTSGKADFDLWEETAHPSVERMAQRAVVIAQDRDVVPFSSWLTDVVAAQKGERALQVLTPPETRLTHSLWTHLTGPLGRWVVRSGDDGYYDGVSGVPLDWHERYGFHPVGLPTDSEIQLATDFTDPEPTGAQLVLDLWLLHRDTAVPRLGHAVELLAEHLCGVAPAAWGPHEPMLARWSPERILEFTRDRAPGPSIVNFSGPLGLGHPFTGHTRVSWRQGGVGESISMAIGFERAEDAPLGALPEAVEHLAGEGLLEGMRARLFGGPADTTKEPRWHGPAMPVGLAIGPEHAAAIGEDQALGGPLGGTVIGRGDAKAVWYPVLRLAESPLSALEKVREQERYLAATTSH